MIDIKAIRELCDKATPGPWSYKTNRHPNTNGTPWGWLEGPAGNMCWSGHQSRTDAAFISKSREIIPALLDELEAAQELSPEATYAIDTHAESLIAKMDALINTPSPQRWIPVTERLPEKDTAVICYTALGQKIGWIGNNGNFNFTYGKGIVTHWMPLPEPPKGESHE